MSQSQPSATIKAPRNPYDIALVLIWGGLAAVALVLWLTAASIRSSAGAPEVYDGAGSMLIWAAALGALSVPIAVAHLISLAVRWRPPAA